MTEYGAPVSTIRTTGDGVGRAYGIVTGMAATPDEALAELRRNAEAQTKSLPSTKLVEHRAETPDERLAEAVEGPAPAEQIYVRYEVVDVRLVMDGGGKGWLAYGTLAEE
jgi:hypothetical protein